MKKNKLVKDIDDDLWRKFSAMCKYNNRKVGEVLEELIKKHLEK